jgi:hypothetical protein
MTQKEKLQIKMREIFRQRTFIVTKRDEIRWINQYVHEIAEILEPLFILKINELFIELFNEIDDTKKYNTNERAKKQVSKFIDKLLNMKKK